MPVGLLGVGDEHDPGAIGHGGKDRIDIGRMVAVVRDHQRRANAASCDLIDGKAVPHLNHFIARPGIGPGDEVEDFVRSCAVNHACRVKLVMRCNRFAQHRRARIGIARQIADMRDERRLSLRAA